METWEIVVIGVAVSFGVAVLTDFARPKQARMWASGPNGETDLVWAPKKPATNGNG